MSKKEGKNLRKQQQQPQFTPAIYGQSQQPIFSQVPSSTSQQQQPQLLAQTSATQEQPADKAALPDALNVQGLDLDSFDHEAFVIKEDSEKNLLTASILQQFHTSPHISTIRAAFVGTPVSVSILFS